MAFGEVFMFPVTFTTRLILINVAAGLHSAYVHREGETHVLTGPAGDLTEYDITAQDFPQLADLLLEA